MLEIRFTGPFYWSLKICLCNVILNGGARGKKQKFHTTWCTNRLYRIYRIYLEGQFSVNHNYHEPSSELKGMWATCFRCLTATRLLIQIAEIPPALVKQSFDYDVLTLLVGCFSLFARTVDHCYNNMYQVFIYPQQLNLWLRQWHERVALDWWKLANLARFELKIYSTLKQKYIWQPLIVKVTF